MNATTRRLAGALLAVLLLGTASGCVHQTTGGDVSTYIYVPWAIFLVGGAGLLALVGSGIVAQHSKWLGFPLLLATVAVLGLFVPNLWLDHVSVTPDVVEVRRGWWWTQRPQKITFREMQEVRILWPKSAGQQRITADASFEWVRRAGPGQRMDLGILGEAAASEILYRAHERGVATPNLDGQ
jgi:hypothetical protein